MCASVHIGHLLGYPGADSGSEGKYKRAEKNGAMKSKERGIFSPARFIYFPSPPLSAPGYSRIRADKCWAVKRALRSSFNV